MQIRPWVSRRVSGGGDEQPRSPGSAPCPSPRVPRPRSASPARGGAWTPTPRSLAGVRLVLRQLCSIKRPAHRGFERIVHSTPIYLYLGFTVVDICHDCSLSLLHICICVCVYTGWVCICVFLCMYIKLGRLFSLSHLKVNYSLIFYPKYLSMHILRIKMTQKNTKPFSHLRNLYQSHNIV